MELLHFSSGLLILFVVLNVLIRFPLFGSVLVCSGFILPFPKFVCAYLSTGDGCGVSPALNIGLEGEIHLFWRVYLLALGILIPLGMEL